MTKREIVGECLQLLKHAVILDIQCPPSPFLHSFSPSFVSCSFFFGKKYNHFPSRLLSGWMLPTLQTCQSVISRGGGLFASVGGK